MSEKEKDKKTSDKERPRKYRPPAMPSIREGVEPLPHETEKEGDRIPSSHFNHAGAWDFATHTMYIFGICGKGIFFSSFYYVLIFLL